MIRAVHLSVVLMMLAALGGCGAGGGPVAPGKSAPSGLFAGQ